MKTHILSILLLLPCLGVLGNASAAIAWKNVDEAHYLAGRKCSEGYLQGKVVFVCRDAALAARMEEIWTSFKTKPTVVLGSFDAAPATGVSYPVYSGAALGAEEPAAPIYVVDETGRVRYKGKDERLATEVLVTAITDMEAPKNEASFREFLDYELENLPGRAVLRGADFRKRFPKAAKAYEPKFAELAKVPDVKKLAELVKFARTAKDAPVFDPKKGKAKKDKFVKSIRDALSKYAKLKESGDPRVVQEAKNALADLKWTLAEQ